MRIVHVSRFDGGDGAANAAYRLHRGLIAAGHHSTLFVADRRVWDADGTIQTFRPSTAFVHRVRRRWRRTRITRDLAPYATSRPGGYEAFSDDRVPHEHDVVEQLPGGEVVNVHSMYQFVDFRAFFTAVPRNTPVVRTLHDMSFFTGGCHSNAGCERFTGRCGACPQLGSRDEDDLSRQIWRRKHVTVQAVPRGRLHVVTPSRWLAGEAKRSGVLQGVPVSVIPHGLDLEVFQPRAKDFARDILGTSQDARIVLFVGESLSRTIKGFPLLAEAVNGLTDVPNLQLVSVGSGKPPAEVRIPHLHLGLVRNERVLSLAYSAADVLAISSLQENLPFAALEALACGTPIAAFAVGGIPDIVRPDVTGVLAPARDVGALRAGIRDLLLDGPRLTRLAANCRAIAESEYSLETQTRTYLALYQSMLADR